MLGKGEGEARSEPSVLLKVYFHSPSAPSRVQDRCLLGAQEIARLQQGRVARFRLYSE